MIRIFKTEDGAMHEKEEMQPGCWIALTNPTASEILEIADACQIDMLMEHGKECEKIFPQVIRQHGCQNAF